MTRRDGGTAGAISSEEAAETSKRSVIRYALCLFAAVIFFTVLSYMMQNRDNVRMDRLYSENVTAIQHIETLQEEYSQLQEQYNELLASYNNLLDQIGTEVVTND